MRHQTHTSKRFLLLLNSTFLLAFTGIFAQPTMPNSARILHDINRLNTVGSVLYIAAHPDDENTRLLAYLANELKLRTGYLSLTRGDGGQNLIGTEQGAGLGLIRTNELLAARGMDGAEQFFTRANDFGYSKNPEETFRFWNKDSVLADVVWTIRKFKPSVIICRFPTTGEGGHGHHTASAILAEEAFEVAADPKRFPEQLKYVTVWQAERIFWNTFNFGTTNTTADDQLKIDIGVFNPLLGNYYGEIAANSRSMHKSQGFGSAKTRGTAIEYFKQLKGTKTTSSVFEDIDFTWNQFPETKGLAAQIQTIIQNYSAAEPAKSVAALAALYSKLSNVRSENATTLFWVKQKQQEVAQLLLQCGGFYAEATSSHFIGVPRNSVDITAAVVANNTTEIRLESMRFIDTDTTLQLTLKQNGYLTFKHREILSNKLEYSDPYWLRKPAQSGLYVVPDQLQRGKPENDPVATVTFKITIAGVTLDVVRPIVYKTVDPVKGEVYRPFEVLPPATVNLEESVITATDDSPKTVHLLVRATAGPVQGRAKLEAPEGWIVQIENPSFNLLNKGDEVRLTAELIPTKTALDGLLNAEVLVVGSSYLNAIRNQVVDGVESFNQSIQRIQYDHIPYQFILSPATTKLIRIPMKMEGKRIGYIPGAGDEVAACLTQIGYEVTQLTDDWLLSGDLAKFDAIVSGVRAYNTNERLQVYYPRLMEYVKNGGNFIIQYNTNSRIGPVKAKIGPYPFTISRNRVTDETAVVRFLAPKHPVLNFPNAITISDFDGWVQERGIYFATDIDTNYLTPLAFNDPGEKEDKGSLIVSSYGKGNFVYTGLAFFRELPAGVPGAYRLMVNLLSIPKNN